MILYAEIECMMYEGHSLKDKRSIIKRLFQKLRQEFNVALTELDYHDLWQRTKIGIVTISNNTKHAEQVLQRVLQRIDNYSELERTITNIEHV
ncbi:DUF503 domain-containing protein [Oceanobacillus halotolerans]|uniref:DUF503 domain-containing protein n=1 Tax=Oceanobacillus halotolerans TaxID=2663380 RepID=UPI0013D97C11|nr:DUF503 domain-containing protein [Oceanobacillus halotolerans]